MRSEATRSDYYGTTEKDEKAQDQDKQKEREKLTEKQKEKEEDWNEGEGEGAREAAPPWWPSPCSECYTPSSQA